MPEIRLVYRSHRAPHVTDTMVVDDIVLPAMAKNRRLNISGCLWFDDRRFLQALEGEAEPLDALYSTIQADDRHQELQLLAHEPIVERKFTRWSMKPMSARVPDPISAAMDELGLKRVAAGVSAPPASADGPVQRMLGLLVARSR